MKNILTLVVLATTVACTGAAMKQVDYGSNPLAGKYASVNGIKLYYETYGEGEPLLLFHGNGGSIEDFALQIPELSKHFKVIAVDSRAQGRSTDSDDTITYALMASDMNGLLNELKLDSVYVLGFSDGGNIGLELAYAHPEKVKMLVTLGANYSFANADAPKDSIEMDPKDPLIANLLELEKGRSARASKRSSPVPQSSPEIRNKLQLLMQKYPTFTIDQLKKIQVPTLVVAGDHDLINIDQTIELFTNLPHSQLFIVPHATHFALLEQPGLMNDEVIRFFSTPYRDIDRYYFFKYPK